ncbi:MAG: hypothetical protein IIW40_02770 [Clostridia bacterium]|nr:hypothetical protein [Clostridia bacterium]
MHLDTTGQEASSRMESRNIAMNLTMEMSTCLITLFASGALWQGLLLHCGLSMTQVGTLGAVASIAQALAMVLDLWLADRFRRPLVVMTVAVIPCIVFFAVIAAMCFMGESVFSFPVVLVSVFVYFAFYGFRSVLLYKVPYLIFRMERYGPLLAVGGFASNLLSMVAGLGINVLLERREYLSTMAVLYVVCTVLAAVVALSTLLMRPLYVPRETVRVPLKEVLADDSIRFLSGANFMRGISWGIIASITLIAAGVFQKDAAALSVMVTLTMVGTTIGHLLFGAVSRPAWLSRVLMAAGILLAVTGPLAVVMGKWVLFLVLFVPLQIAYIVVGDAIPVILAQTTSYQIIGGCTAVRLIVSMVGMALSSWLTGFLMEVWGGRGAAVVLMLIAGLSQVYCGVTYYRHEKRAKSKQLDV